MGASEEDELLGCASIDNDFTDGFHQLFSDVIWRWAFDFVKRAEKEGASKFEVATACRIDSALFSKLIGRKRRLTVKHMAQMRTGFRSIADELKLGDVRLPTLPDDERLIVAGLLNAANGHAKRQVPPNPDLRIGVFELFCLQSVFRQSDLQRALAADLPDPADRQLLETTLKEAGVRTKKVGPQLEEFSTRPTSFELGDAPLRLRGLLKEWSLILKFVFRCLGMAQ